MLVNSDWSHDDEEEWREKERTIVEDIGIVRRIHNGDIPNSITMGHRGTLNIYERPE